MVRRPLTPLWCALGVALICAIADAPASAHHPAGSPAALPLGLMIGGALVVLLGWVLVRIRKRRDRAADQAAHH